MICRIWYYITDIAKLYAAYSKSLNFSSKDAWLRYVLYLIILYYIKHDRTEYSFGPSSNSNRENVTFISLVIKHEFAYLQSIHELNFKLSNYATLKFKIDDILHRTKDNMLRITCYISNRPYEIDYMTMKWICNFCLKIVADFEINECSDAKARFKTKSIL